MELALPVDSPELLREACFHLNNAGDNYALAAARMAKVHRLPYRWVR